jgi:hypothetical protein
LFFSEQSIRLQIYCLKCIARGCKKDFIEG